MNALKIYNALITQARSRGLLPKSVHSRKKGYANHHILPASLFPAGRNDKQANHQSNLIYLTHREHFLAHWLLARIYGGPLSHAFACMSKKHGMISSKAYEKHLADGLAWRSKSGWNERRAEAVAKTFHSPQVKAKRAASAKARFSSEEGRQHLKKMCAGRDEQEYKNQQSLSQPTRKIVIGTPENGGPDIYFQSISAATKSHGCNRLAVGRSTPCKGYYWRYATPAEITQYETNKDSQC